jgi:FHA domain
MDGKHHASGWFGAGDVETCPRCKATVAGQFCEACGSRVSARRPLVSLGHPAESSAVPAGSAELRETSLSGRAKSGPPESLFPPISESEPAFSAWSKPASLAQPEPAALRAFAEPLAAPAGPEAPQQVVPRQDLTVPAVTPAHSAPPTTPIPSLTTVTWTLLVASDRVYYDRMRAERSLPGSPVEFPAHTSERRIRLAGKQMRIGRRSAGRDLVPEIDLADRPVDPGISRLHAVLSLAPDGTWCILDPGSANGTFVNGRELATGEMVTLHEGDRINLGAWTVITVHRG